MTYYVSAQTQADEASWSIVHSCVVTPDWVGLISVLYSAGSGSMKHDDGIEVFLKLSGVETGPAQIPELLDPFSDSDGIDWTKCHVLVQGQHIDIIVKFTQGSKFFTGKAVTAVIVFGAGQPLSDQEPVRKFWPASARTRRESHILEGYQWVSSQGMWTQFKLAQPTVC